MKDAIIIHCSATRAEQDITAADIESWHRARGFWTIGYHYVIRLDGTIEPGRDVTSTAHIAWGGTNGQSASAMSADWTRTVAPPIHAPTRNAPHSSDW